MTPGPLDIRASVLISSYNQPRELELALTALARQSRLPDQVLVADDGSTFETRSLIERLAASAPFPLEHVWQEDRGYRKSRILNEAARRATGDQLLLIDGDTFPHRHWVRDHLANRTDRRILCGRRVKLGPALSPTVTVEDIRAGRFDSPFRAGLVRSRLAGDTKRLTLGLRLPRPLARLLHPRPRKLMGVNFSLPKSAFVEVNGFDEEWTVYGHEDRDLELRLARAGFPFVAVLNQAVVFHLHHEERERSDTTRRLVKAAEESTNTRCARGYALEGAFDPHG